MKRVRRYTTAPPSFDLDTTRTLRDNIGEYMNHKTVRLVEIAEPLLEAQKMRYASGLHSPATPERWQELLKDGLVTEVPGPYFDVYAEGAFHRLIPVARHLTAFEVGWRFAQKDRVIRLCGRVAAGQEVASNGDRFGYIFSYLPKPSDDWPGQLLRIYLADSAVSDTSSLRVNELEIDTVWDELVNRQEELLDGDAELLKLTKPFYIWDEGTLLQDIHEFFAWATQGRLPDY